MSSSLDIVVKQEEEEQQPGIVSAAHCCYLAKFHFLMSSGAGVQALFKLYLPHMLVVVFALNG